MRSLSGSSEGQMGIRTLQTYRDELGAVGIGSLQRSGIGNALVDRWVNEAMREFGYAFKFHELEANTTFTTVVGTASYIIGTDVDVDDFRYAEEMWAVHPETGVVSRIRPETRTRYRKNTPTPTDTTSYGTPSWYHRFINRIYLRATPDAVYTIEFDYFKNILPMAEDTDTSPFHEDWDEIIAVGALYRGFRHFGEFDRYQNVRNDFLGLVRSRKTEFELEEFPEGGISPLGPHDTEEVEEAP